MADILLANSYFLQYDKKQLKQMKPYPPLATIYAASVLKQKKYTIDFFDTVFANSEKEIFPLIEKNAGNIFVIYDDGFNYLTKMCLVNMRNACFEMIHFARKNNMKVLVSSSDATDHWKEYLDEGADFILIGEAENTLIEVIDGLKKNSNEADFNHINGLAFKKGDEYLKTMKREVMHDLDALPFPDWNLIDIKKYKHNWIKKNRYFSLNLTTTRGCPFKCNWCAKPIYGNRYNSRSPENVVEEIKFLLHNFQPTHFWFCDDIFGLKPGWIKRFSELVEKENLKFKFKIQCRADLLLDENPSVNSRAGNIEYLAKAGCDEIWIGAESGSQKILDAMDKGTTIEQIYRCTELMKKHKIKPCFFLQFGYLGETKEDIKATQKMLFDLMPHDIGISVSYPLPGTKFYEKVKNDLKEKQNWNDSDELLMMYRSTYSPVYYKQLHRYVHKKFRKKQGMENFKRLLSAKKLSATELKRIFAVPYFGFMQVLFKFKMQSSIMHTS